MCSSTAMPHTLLPVPHLQNPQAHHSKRNRKSGNSLCVQAKPPAAMAPARGPRPIDLHVQVELQEAQ
jgi:hypothetical protein